MASSSESLDNVPLKFHTVHSRKVRVSRDGIRAVCPNLGVVFSNRPLRLVEKVSIRIPKFRATLARSAIIFFGVSEVDPHLLNSSVTKPNFSCEDFLTLYQNPALRVLHAVVHADGNDEMEDGMHIASVMLVRTMAFVSFNDVLQKTITDVNGPLWVVFMLSAPGVEEIFIEIGDGKNDQAARGHDVPASIMTVNYGRISPTHEFHHYTGQNVFISARNTGLRFRQNHFGANGYLFLRSNVTAGTGVVLKVLQTCNDTEGSMGFGLTSCNPDSLVGHQLPDDPDALHDRPEYWVYKPDIANGIAAYDELCFSTFESGVVEMSRNGGPPVFLMCVDTSVPLYMFFNLVGSVKEIRLMGSFLLPRTATTSDPQQDGDEDVVSVIEVTSEGPRQEALPANSGGMPRAIAPVVSASIATANTSRSTVNTVAVATASRSQEERGREEFAAFTRSHNSRSRNFAERQILAGGVAGMRRSIAPISSVPTSTVNNVTTASTSHFRVQGNVWYNPEQIVPNAAHLAAPGPSSRGRHARHSEGFVCIICMDRRISHIVIECGHWCLCSQCAAAYDKNAGCPMCRAKIRNIIQVYAP